MKVDKSQRLSFLWRFTYVMQRTTLFFFREKKTLKVVLRMHWLLRRVAFELSASIYGTKFQNNALGLNEAVLREIVGANDTVADLGCGSGRWTKVCAQIADTVYAIDSNSASEKLLGDQDENVIFLNLDLEYEMHKMPRVQIALLVHFLEHVNFPGKLLRELRFKAEKIIIEVPDFESDPLNFVRLWTGEPFYFDSDHVEEFSLEEITALLSESDWTPIFIRQKGGTILLIAE